MTWITNSIPSEIMLVFMGNMRLGIASMSLLPLDNLELSLARSLKPSWSHGNGCFIMLHLGNRTKIIHFILCAFVRTFPVSHGGQRTIHSAKCSFSQYLSDESAHSKGVFQIIRMTSSKYSTNIKLKSTDWRIYLKFVCLKQLTFCKYY